MARYGVTKANRKANEPRVKRAVVIFLSGVHMRRERWRAGVQLGFLLPDFSSLIAGRRLIPSTSRGMRQRGAYSEPSEAPTNARVVP